jgi:hypothetical protein
MVCEGYVDYVTYSSVRSLRAAARLNRAREIEKEENKKEHHTDGLADSRTRQTDKTHTDGLT